MTPTAGPPPPAGAPRPSPAGPLPAAPLGRGTLLGYALGSVGTGIFSTVPGLLLLYYLTDVLGVAAAVAGLVVVLPKAWDVVFNPYVGAASDRQAIRRGTRTRLMLLGAVSLPVAFALMFAGVGSGPTAAAYVAVTFLVAATCYALFQVPYVALPAEMSEDTHERSRIMGWRIVALTVGILVGGAVAPMIVTAGGGGAGGYRSMGVLVGVLLLGAMLVASLSTRWVRSHPGEQPLGLRQALRVARGNRAFVALLASFVLQALGIAIALAGVAYVATYFLGDYALTSAIFVAIVAPSVAVVPMWVRLGARHGKAPVLLGVVLGLVVVLGLFTLAAGSRSIPAVLGAALGVGIFYGGSQVLPYAMLTDAIVVDERRSGRRQAGAFTGVWTALETAAFAVGPGLFSMLLAVTGFASSTFDEPVTQSASALRGIAFGVGVVPALLFALSVPLVRRFGRSEAARIDSRGS